MENKSLANQKVAVNVKPQYGAPKIISRDIPLQEITLRKYESPQNMNAKELAKKFLLSIGLLQPAESRDVIVYLFRILLSARKSKQLVPLEKFIELLKNRPGGSAPNIRRQLRRLKDMKLVERLSNGYRITDSISNTTENFIIPFIVNQSIERLKEYAKGLDS